MDDLEWLFEYLHYITCHLADAFVQSDIFSTLNIYDISVNIYSLNTNETEKGWKNYILISFITVINVFLCNIF